MANYNSGFKYNLQSNYNSAAYLIIEVSDACHGEEIISILANILATDSAIGIDNITEINKFDANIYFVVTCDSILEPLKAYVLHDKNIEMPSIKNITEEIPGRHGEVYLDSNLGSRLIELHVVAETDFDPLEKENLKRNMAKYLNPINGAKSLVFLDEPEKTYRVKYAGKINLNQYPDWMEFTIPFKMADPYIIGSIEKTHTGSGIITNQGNADTPFVIQIIGPTTNPIVIIGSKNLKYNGIIQEEETLIVDTEKRTVTLNNAIALNGWEGGFPKLQSGDNLATAGNNVTFKWRDRWV